jgi:hypothetical protein
MRIFGRLATMTIQQLEKVAEPMTPMPEGKSRKPRADQGEVRLTPRDIEILTWVGEMYAIRLDHLQQLMGRYRVQRPPGTPGADATGALAVTSVQTAVRRWKRAGLVEYQKMLPGKPHYIWLTNSGFKQTGLPYKNGAPAVARLKHLDTVNVLRLHLENTATLIWEWRSDRAIRHQLNTFNPKVRQQLTHTPDAEIITEDGRRWAIEVELTPKSWLRYHQIMAELRRSDYDEFRYFCNERTLPVLNAVKEDTSLIREHRDPIKIFRLPAHVEASAEGYSEDIDEGEA